LPLVGTNLPMVWGSWRGAKIFLFFGKMQFGFEPFHLYLTLLALFSCFNDGKTVVCENMKLSRQLDY